MMSELMTYKQEKTAWSCMTPNVLTEITCHKQHKTHSLALLFFIFKSHAVFVVENGPFTHPGLTQAIFIDKQVSVAQLARSAR